MLKKLFWKLDLFLCSFGEHWRDKTNIWKVNY